jgi:hypothetical protein
MTTTIVKKFLRRDASLVVLELDEEALVLDEEARVIHQLNATASFIWRQCAEPRSAEAITGALMAAYQVEPEVASRDVRQMLERLEALNLICQVDAPEPLGARRKPVA